MKRWIIAAALFGALPTATMAQDADMEVISRVMVDLKCDQAIRLFQGEERGGTGGEDRLALISFLYGYAVHKTKGTDNAAPDAFMAAFYQIAATCTERPNTSGLLNMLGIFEAN